MGDSTAMTIEFLRARLLSERSVSRSARQRADQLAKRVVELEEQLRIVTIQRKKAEKAAGDVLAILESQGVSDVCEFIDSSSDQDHLPIVSKGSDDNAREDEIASRMDKSDVEDAMSGSEVELSSPQGRSLSWKACNSSSDVSTKEYQASQRQGRGLVSRVGSSSQHRLGKSCRKIQSARNMGSISENGSNTTEHDQTSDCGDNEAQLYKVMYEIEQKSPEESDLHSSEEQIEGKVVNLYADGLIRDDEAIEKALKQQAQLIGQFQAEENAQREWEEKYKDNNRSVLVPIKQLEMPESPSEENDPPIACNKLGYEESTSDKETKRSDGSTGGLDDQVVHSGEAATSAHNSYGLAVSNRICNSDVPQSSVNIGGSRDHRHGTVADVHGNGLRGSELPGSQPDISKKHYQEACRSEPSGSSPTGSPSSSGSNDRCSRGQWPLVQHSSPPESSNPSLGNVLDALQRAKFSLEQVMNKMQKQPTSPPQSGLVAAAARDPQSPDMASGDPLSIPFGSAGLFRLPTDATPPSSYLPSRLLHMPTQCLSYCGTGLGMSTLRSFAQLSDGLTLNACTETRTAITSAMNYMVRARPRMPPFTSGHGSALAITNLAAASSYSRMQGSSNMGRREISGVDRHAVRSADRSHHQDFAIQRLKE